MNQHLSHSGQDSIPMHHALFAIVAMVGGLFSMMLLFIATFHGFVF